MSGVAESEPGPAFVGQSAESLPQVIIELFADSRDKYTGVAQFVKKRARCHVLGAKALLIVGSNFLQIGTLSEVVRGHMFGRRGRQRAFWEEALAGIRSHVFIEAVALNAVGDFGHFELMAFDLRDVAAVSLSGASVLWFFLTEAEFARCRERVPDCVRLAFMFEQIAALPADYSRSRFCLLKDYAPEHMLFPFPDGREMPEAIKNAVRQWAELPACEFCGAVLLRGMPQGFCCKPFDAVMRDHLPHDFDPVILRRIEELSQRQVNFPRILNRDLRPVIQNARISGPRGGGATLFISGMPYAVDTFRQFVTPVYAVFQMGDSQMAEFRGESAKLIAELLKHNSVLRGYLRDRLESRANVAVATMDEPDPGMNLAVLNAEGPCPVAHEIVAVQKSYAVTKIPGHAMLYDKLVYPLIFWDGHGGCGSDRVEDLRSSGTLIRKCAIALILQHRDHFIHRLALLREEFICAISGRLCNLQIKFLSLAQKRYFVREDEVRGAVSDGDAKEYGMRSFIPASLTDSNEYWREVATKCFAISTQFGAPTFFLTFTMNPNWIEFQALKRGPGNYGDSAMASMIFRLKLNALMRFVQSEKVLGEVRAFVWRIEYQKRGLPHAHILFWTDYDTADMSEVDKVVSVQMPRDSPFPKDADCVADFRTMIRLFQVHNHSKRCGGAKGRCKFGYPQRAARETSIRGHQYVFKRGPGEGNIVPHNPRILATFRCHHCLEVIHSDQCIGYVLKYCAKNTDEGSVGIQQVLYEGRPVTPGQRLEYFAASRVSSACECFAGICGYWRHHLKPTVIALTVHLEGKKVVLAGDRRDEENKIDLPSRLERYFGRPRGIEYERLTYQDYYSKYMLSSRPGSDQGVSDLCVPPQFAVIRKKPALAILNSVSIRDRELFALRLLLRIYPARSWDALRTCDGDLLPSFEATVKSLGLVNNVDDEARIALRDAVELNRPPSDLRFLFAQLSCYVSNGAELREEFWRYFFDAGDTDESVSEKLRRLTECDSYLDANFAPSSERLLDMLTLEQKEVASAIIDSVVRDGEQLMFLQGSAGTGKTFTVQVIVAELRRLGFRCLISATTGIAAAQYEGGSTVHSLFRLGIDEASSGEFRCNVGKGTAQARYLLAADLIVIDEVSMLTPWVANRVSLTLRAICENERDFGGRKVLFVGDLLQLPPVTKGFSGPIIHRLILRLPCWQSIRKFRLSMSVRTHHSEWAAFLSSVSVGLTGDCVNWSDLGRRFGVLVTNDIDLAQSFFCYGLSPADKFPLDRQWICPTNRLSREVNDRLQSWRGTGACFLGRISAATVLVTPLRAAPGLSVCQQLDFLEQLDSPDLPCHVLSLFEGDPLVILRNLDTASGLAKGRRCSAMALRNRTVVMSFENGEEKTLSRMPMEKTSNGMRFQRWQVPIRLIFAGTVHRSQGMTLQRAVVDCRSNFWEHGQLYVALSRVRDPGDLCILLPPDMGDGRIKVHVDHQVVEVVQGMVSQKAEVLDTELGSIPEACQLVSQSPTVVRSSSSGEEQSDRPISDDDVQIHDSEVVADGSSRDCSPISMTELLGEKRELLSFDGLEKSLVDLGPPSRFVSCRRILSAVVNSCTQLFGGCQSSGRGSRYLSAVCNSARVMSARMLALLRWQRNHSAVCIPRGPVLASAYSFLGGGLLNRTRNCYINAFLQVMFNLLPLRLLLLCWPGTDYLPHQIKLIFIHLSRKKLICPDFLSEFSEPGAHGDKDCAEFGMTVLGDLRDVASGILAHTLESLIFFQLVRIVAEADAEERFLGSWSSILTISSHMQVSLVTALDDYFGPSVVPNRSNCWEHFAVRCWPKYLLINIGRYYEVDGRVQKDCSCFPFPLELDLSRYDERGDQQREYCLAGVIAHRGVPESRGSHYFAFCKVLDEWFLFDDSSVNRVSQARAIEDNFPRRQSSMQTAFLLVYAACGQTTVQSTNEQ